MTEYRISGLERIEVDIPVEVQEILNDEIIESEHGTTFKSWKHRLYAADKVENTSMIEDNQNHFHVGWCAKPYTEISAFKLGVKTSMELAKRLRDTGLKDVQVSYSFSTNEMSRKMEIDHNQEESAEHYFGDRISFNRIRVNEVNTLRVDIEEYKYDAVLIIEL